MHSYLQKLARIRGFLTYHEFVQEALYHPDWGYYLSSRDRVGKSPDTDFYTSMSLGATFGKLILESIKNLIPDEDLSKYTFVEIAAEPETSVFLDINHPFQDHLVIRLGDSISVSGQVVVFSNEWLDAQPFHRLVFRNGVWREIVVKVEDGELKECELEEFTTDVRKWVKRLPQEYFEGYHMDVPSGAETMLDQLLSQDWSGLFLTLDYGKSLQELLEVTPQGTARAYYRHQQSNDLLASPGKQDLTCHLCWDWLESLLEEYSFNNVRTIRQESLFMRHASKAIQEILENSTNPQETGRIKELLHPSHFGHKFQALYGIRTKKH